MSSEPADTLTRSLWLDRIIMAAFVLVFGFTFVRGALDVRFGGGIEWRTLGFAFLSAAFWLAVIRSVVALFGVVL